MNTMKQILQERLKDICPTLVWSITASEDRIKADAYLIVLQVLPTGPPRTETFKCVIALNDLSAKSPGWWEEKDKLEIIAMTMTKSCLADLVSQMIVDIEPEGALG